jgi:hypothetical protein
VRSSRFIPLAVTLSALIFGALVISPALGGPSLRSLVKKELSKQIGNAQGPQGQPGPSGPPGASGVAPGATLAAGVTLRGVFAPTDSHPSVGAQVFGSQGVSFGGYRLPARPMTHIIGVGGGSTVDCPGTVTVPEAASGHLCVYLSYAPADVVTATDPVAVGNGFQFDSSPATPEVIGDGKVSAMGFALGITENSSNVATADGSWAVTS